MKIYAKWFVLMLVGLIAPQEAFAQLAPTGAHYAGRASDTGYGGTFVGATGTFAAAIPLELPPARGGLPIPLQITYGSRGVGAAGLGWDLPLSYIQRDRTLAHRRPASGPGAIPGGRERAYLSLLGQSVELVPKGSVWVARSGTLELTVRESAGSWLAYDGKGRTYTFIRPANLGSTGLWLLKSVSVAGGANIQLTYQITTWPLDGGVGTAIDLLRVAYNTHATAGCAKNEVALTYGFGSITPLSMSILGDKVLVRKNTLTLVDVSSRATCGTPFERLRRYEFQYLPDTDTHLPRLRTVRMFGRQGTPEENTALPIATYDYGSATHGGTLRYERTQVIDLPAGVAHNQTSGTALDPSVNAPVTGDRYAMWQTLTDVTGDGRPDLVFKRNDKLWVAHNRPAPGGKTTLGVGGQAIAQLSDATFANGAFSTHTTTLRRFWFGTANRNIVNVWRQAIDVNGDGRIDIVDAAEQADHWVVYLNTPGGPTGVKWERRSFRVKRLRAALVSRGHVIDGDHVPLSRRTTGVSSEVMVCLKRNGTKLDLYDGTVKGEHTFTDPQTLIETLVTDTWECDHGNPTSTPPSDMPGCIIGTDLSSVCPSNFVEPERTFVEWELSDLNGDGYPDFVFNSSPVEFVLASPAANIPEGRAWVGKTQNLFGLRSLNDIRAMFNVLGVRFSEHDPFSQSVNLFAASSQQGVSEWRCTGWNPGNPAAACDETSQSQSVGFADVNGDGLVDRVVGNKAYLGAYHGAAFTFSRVYITLPGPLATLHNTHKEQCDTGGGERSTADQTQGLRDLTGDGIPDYYDGRVWIGTATGFREPISIAVPGGHFRFSHQTESCDGDTSNTDGGLFDIDGDGRPEVIGLIGSTFVVYQLAGGQASGIPEAGRMTEINNGYGAKTSITYVSAKHFTDNPVPFPEIVVSSVATTGTQNLGGTLAGTRYAYSNAELVFDSALDRFAFPGYRRQVEVRLFDTPGGELGGPAGGRIWGAAVITDSWPLTSFNSALTKHERWLRMQRVGRVRDIFTLRGIVDPDPWSLLGVDANDGRVIGVTHYESNAKLYELPQSPSANALDCMEMVLPLDFALSFANNLGSNGVDVCRAHGFAFGVSRDSWYGAWAPPTNNNVQTQSRALEVDDFGRVTFAEYEGDRFRSDDDVCVENKFATPNGSFPRVLTALASRRVTDCGRRITYASESWTYDGLPAGVVSNGRMTSHSVERRATDNGALLRTVRAFDATYDSAGNLATVRTQRDGSTRKVTFSYDPFGLVPTKTKVDATGVPSTESFVTYNPASLEPLSSTDIHGTQRGADFDGFSRLLRSTVTPPGAPLGVVSTVSYHGFSGTEPDGRRVVVNAFSDPVAPGDVGTSASRSGAAFFDELGRARRTELALGSDYANEVLVVGSRTYDGFGRVVFEADPYPKNLDAATAYGTSYHFKNTGDVDCIIRGRGQQALTEVTNVATERFPTCFDRLFINHVETLEVRDAASLQAGSPQAGVVKRVVSSAIGRVIERSTVKAGARLDYAAFSHDRLGQQTSMTRFLNPAGGNPVQWSWRLDSIGQMLQLKEPETATRFYTYSDWGEPVETQWTDDAIDRRLVSRYDALGRLTATEERNNGVADPETVNNYSYDVGVNVSPQVTPTFVLGRIARASSPSGQVAFSYDAFGRANARTFTDDQGGLYIEKSEHHANGRLAFIEFNLPDQGHDKERVKYAYDSAGRVRTMTHADTTGTRELYRAEGIDSFGRVRKAFYGGNTVYHGDYADAGRRLMKEATVQSSFGSQQVIFLGIDPLGRELSRREIKDGAASGRKTNVSYDALGRLAVAVQTDEAATLFNWNFSYDTLGNVVELKDTLGAADAALSYSATDRDRVCRIGYGAGGLGGTSCNVVHDVLGNVVSQPTRTGSRQLSYFASGGIRTITEQGTQARFRYDAFGKVQALDVQGGTTQDKRRDRRYGGLIEQRDAVSSGSTMSLVTRHIPGPGGIVASRRGPGGEWVFGFGELRGNRVFTDQDGKFIQSVDYQPFGEATSTGTPAGSANYTSYQWNGGDALAAFGLAHLGARVYDPVIGRFLSRDPLLIPRTAATTNPYAFAMNDPVNGADPSGLDCAGNFGKECQPWVPLFLPIGWFGGGGSGAPKDFSEGPRLNDPVVFRGKLTESLGMAWDIESCPWPCGTPVFDEPVPDLPFMRYGPFGIALAWFTLDTPLKHAFDAVLMVTGAFAALNGLTNFVISEGVAFSAAEIAGASGVLGLEVAGNTAGASATFVIREGASQSYVSPGTFRVEPIGPAENFMNYGTRVHQELPRGIAEIHPNAAGEFNVAPGRTGVDFNPSTGYNAMFGEMKSIRGNQGTMLRQARNWQAKGIVADAEKGIYYFYDRDTGMVFEGIIKPK